MNRIYNNQIKNNLGIVHCELVSNLSIPIKVIENEQSIIIKTTSYICELLHIKQKEEWLPEGMSTEQSYGWLWTIKKVNSIKEDLYLKCYLEPSCNVNTYPESGECLDSLMIENTSKIMHIGTEDSETLYSRAESSYYMPRRLIKDFPNTINYIGYTEYINYGFKTSIPELKENEVIYFQYLYAINTRKPSKHYPDEEDVSTWYAVERDRAFLLKELGIKFTI